MSRSKISPESKLKAVISYLAGEGSLVSISQAYGIHSTTLEGWIMRYKAEGTSSFFTTGQKKGYSQEIKVHAVEDYLSGHGSLKMESTIYTSLHKKWSAAGAADQEKYYIISLSS